MVQVHHLLATKTDDNGNTWGIRFAADGIAMWYKVIEGDIETVKLTRSLYVPKEVRTELGKLAPLKEKTTPTKMQPIQTVAKPEPEQASLDQEKVCIFCGNYADSGKFINQRFWPLCRDDYQNHTTGQVVAHLRETSEQRS